MIGKMQNIVRVLSKVRFSNLGQFWRKLLRNLTKELKTQLFNIVGHKYDPENTILIFSENRGGSTWVMESLQRDLKALTLFEPVGSPEFSEFKDMVSSPFYLGGEKTHQILHDFLNESFSGRKSSSRTLQFNTFTRLFNNKYVVAKMNNINLIAPWILENFTLAYKPVYLTRHPLAILASSLRYGNVQNSHFQDEKIDDFDMNRIKSKHHPYLKYMDVVNCSDTKFTRFLTEWCIRNKDFLKGNYEGQVLVVSYEELVLNEEDTYQKIYGEWGIDFNNYYNKAHNQESGTTNLGDKVLSGHEQLRKWMDLFTPNDLEKFQKIFDHFDIKGYTSFDYLPSHISKQC